MGRYNDKPQDVPATGVPGRSFWITDPRSDIATDSTAWEHLLEASYDRIRQPDPVFGALHGARCCGARLDQHDRALTLSKGSEDDDPDGSAYELAREVFFRYRDTIRRLLADAGNKEPAT